MKRQNKIGLNCARICLFLLTVIPAVGAKADEPNGIGELLKEKGFDWFIGKWEATTNKGEKACAEFALDINDYVVCANVQVDGYKYRGLMFLVPSKRIIVNVGADNRGGNFDGSCEIEGDKLIMNLEQMSDGGVVTKFTRYLSSIDADTMKSVTYLFKDGKRSEEPVSVLEFKRVAP